MYDKSKVEIGDILQHKTRGKGDWLGLIINFFTLGGNYAHTAMYIGNGLKVEAHMGAKFGQVKIEDKEYKYIDIFRINRNLDGDGKTSLTMEAKKLYGVDYDTFGLGGTVYSGLGKFLNWSWLRQVNPVSNDKKKLFCSEAISKIYLDSIKIDICPQVGEEVTTPNDIGRSNMLYKVN